MLVRMRTVIALVPALAVACSPQPGASSADDAAPDETSTSTVGTSTSATESSSDVTATTTAATTTTTSDTGVVDESSTGEPSPIGWTPALAEQGFVCKLVSDTELDDPSANHTHTRFNLRGTDLGVPVIAAERLHLFFGDTVGYRVIWDFGEDPDAVGWIDAATVAADPSALCDSLAFLVTPDVPSVAAGTDPSVERDFAGAAMAPPAGETLAQYIAQPAGPFDFMPGTFEVPSGALGRGDQVWLFYAGLVELAPTRATLGYLATWNVGDLPSYQIVRPIDRLGDGALGGHFIQIAPVEREGTVWMFGTGDYRRSGVYLARVASDALATGDGTELFDPIAGSWSEAATLTSEQRAAIAPMFDSDGVGELGVQWIPEAEAWIAVYQRELHDAGGNIVDNRIVLRSAAAPEGPWSDALTIIDMADPAFQLAHCCGATCPGEQLLHCDVAGLYGAYPLPLVRTTITADGPELEIPYVVSTWDPYNVVLMTMRVALAPAPMG